MEPCPIRAGADLGLEKGAPNDQPSIGWRRYRREDRRSHGKPWNTQRIQLINEYRRMAGEVPRRLCVACRAWNGAMVQAIAIGALRRVLRNLPIPRKPLRSKAHSPISRMRRASLRVLYTTARLDPLYPCLLLLERILKRGHMRWGLVKGL